MKRSFLGLGALAVALTAWAAHAEEHPYGKRLDITLPAYAPGSALGGVPVPIALSPSIAGFDYRDFQASGGADMVFKDADGNVLPHEIDTWNEEGESLVWVKAPTIAGGETISCFYGGEAAADTSADVWTGYTGVWHMGAPGTAEYGGKSYAAIPNSTGLEGTPGLIEGVSQPGADGIVGKAVDVASTDPGTGGISGGVFVPYSAGLQAWGTFTLSAWIKLGENHNRAVWNKIFGNRTTVNGVTKGFDLDCADFGSGAGNKPNNGAFRYYCNGGKIDRYLPFDPPITSASWTHLAFVFDGKTLTYYENGVPVGENLTDAANLKSAMEDGGGILGLGNQGGNFGKKVQSPLLGFIDECRIHPGVRPAADIAAEYAVATRRGEVEYGEVVDLHETYYPLAVTLRSGTVGYAPEPHHFGEDGKAYYLSGTEVTVTASDPAAVGFLEWISDAPGAVSEGAAITFTVRTAANLSPLWRHQWAYVETSAGKGTVSDGYATLPVKNSGGRLTVFAGDAETGAASIDSFGIVDLAAPISGGDKWFGEIADLGFSNCVALAKVVLPDAAADSERALVKIGKAAFCDCQNLKSVVPLLPASVATIGDSAFAGSPVAGDLTLSGSKPAGVKSFQNTAISSASAPLMERIETGVFQNCAALTNAVFPQVKRIGSYAFASCGRLQTVAAGELLERIDERAFRNCAAMETFSPAFPESIYKIENQAFDNCKSLAGTLAFTSPVMTVMTNKVFQSVNAVQELLLPHLRIVGDWNFTGMQAVTNIVFGRNAVEFTGPGSFQVCRAGCTIRFPGKAPEFTVFNRPFGEVGGIVCCDLVMDRPGWEAIMAKEYFVPVSADAEMLKARDYPGPGTLGQLRGMNGAQAYSYWLVSYRSPLRPQGMVILVR